MSDPERGTDETAKPETAPAGDLAEREAAFTRRALLRAGWTAPVVLAAAMPQTAAAQTGHSDVAHTDSHTDSHTDEAHADTHTDVAHVDGAADSPGFPVHGDIVHGDIPHNDIPHNDIPHNDIPHGDIPHSDT